MSKILEVKTCTRCEVKKPLTEFHRNRTSKDGRMAQCRECSNKYDKQRGQTLHRKASLALKDARRARKKAEKEVGREIEDTLTLAEVMFTLKQEECRYCGNEVPEKDRSLDHITPMYYGGTNTFANVTMACKPCNSAKNDTPVILHYIREEITAQEAAELICEVAIKDRITFKEAFEKLYADAKNYLEFKTAKALERAERLRAEATV